MAWQQSDLDAIDTALSGGIKSVTYADGRRVEFQTTGEMLSVRKAMKAELLSATAQTRTRFTIGRTCRA